MAQEKTGDGGGVVRQRAFEERRLAIGHPLNEGEEIGAEDQAPFGTV